MFDIDRTSKVEMIGDGSSDVDKDCPTHGRFERGKKGMIVKNR